GALEFSGKAARDVMVTVPELITLPVGCTPAEVEQAVAQTGFSRFPIISEDGELPGYLHLKDVLYATGGDRNVAVPLGNLRGLMTVLPDDEIEDVLAVMQRRGAHMAVVRSDVAGPALGMVFLEDILEELVGEVSD